MTRTRCDSAVTDQMTAPAPPRSAIAQGARVAAEMPNPAHIEEHRSSLDLAYGFARYSRTGR